ncbi:MAG TPA: T9SS type A sorting domain-containing protein [Candidatus Marinimicrobia bacterium]|nr:T9SS type A sorting domain-containing protein [Candidatus Neomarinimicrobiota bacterium]
MNNGSVKITNQLIGDSLEFSWRASSDVEGDDITYLWVGSNGLDSVKVASVKNTTSLTITYSVLHDAIDWSENSEISGSWTISATDGTVHTQASNGPYTLTLSDKVQDVSGENLQPLEFSLLQNYPNPFNSGTTINYILPENSDVEIVIYTLLGHPVKTLVNKRVNSGFHAVSWDGKDDSGNTVSGGIYLYRIRATNFTAVRKMLLLK